VQLVQEYRAVGLLEEAGRVVGVAAADAEGRPVLFAAPAVVLATGGVGHLFERTTNPPEARGIGLAMAGHAGAVLADLEMVQFHPTALADGSDPAPLLTEALRGEGAFVTGESGNRFLFDYDDRGELASRDIVSRGIFDYKRRTGENAYLDFSSFDEEWFHHRFPNITQTFDGLGYKFPRDRVSISPAFHYANGGIAVDDSGVVSGMDGLYAVGEVARTGVHGANRLASNSLLEAMVFAKRATEHIMGVEQSSRNTPRFDKDYDNILHQESDKKYKHQLREIMRKDVGIIRNTDGLIEAKNFIYDVKNRKIGRLLELRLNTAAAIVSAALSRKTSLGSHYMEKV